jgi:hypothetical protein
MAETLPLDMVVTKAVAIVLAFSVAIYGGSFGLRYGCSYG